MNSVEGQPVLTAAATRAAEDRAIAAGASISSLMERAGAGVAEAVRRLAAGAPVLVLCGPGNNGGDGYVAARVLKANGADVRIAALGEPNGKAAVAARASWDGAVETLAAADYAPIVVDAVFGTGLTRPLDRQLEERLGELIGFTRLSIAVDLPSGLDSDGGKASATQPEVDVTVALGALKPAHVLYPAAAHCGTVRVVDIGLDLFDQPMADVSADWTMQRPWVDAPYGSMHKYSRGMVVVIGGAMPGAAALSAEAAAHAGAGYVLLFGDDPPSAGPHALVRKPWSAEALDSAVAGKAIARTAIVVGPGLGAGEAAAAKLEAAIASGLPLVIDGDALRLLDDAQFERFHARPVWNRVVLTPHEGEFRTTFGTPPGNKLAAARAAAERSGATVVYKGPDTVVSHPDGRCIVATGASAWLSTAGTGDVLAGTIAAMLTAATLAPVEAGVWLHAEAARQLGGAFLADDLAQALPAVRSAL